MKNRWIKIPKATVFGAPISIHWTVLLALIPLSSIVLANPTFGLITAVSYFLIITIHELGHAIVANSKKCRVLEIRLGLIHGQCVFEQPYYEYEDLLIAWGGVVAQLLVAIPLIILGSYAGDVIPSMFSPIISILGYFNLFIALFNLIPIRGYDGYKAWKIVPYILRKK